MQENNRSVWTLKSKGRESAFGGNEGYPDDPKSHYVYDTTVKNHNKVCVGDVVIIADKWRIIGAAVIEEIKAEQNLSKIRFRCPLCRSQEIAARKNIFPRYKCRKKHEFDEPITEEVRINRFTAYYGSSFSAVRGLEAKALKPYYINHNLYYSIQKTQFSFFKDQLQTRGLFTQDVINQPFTSVTIVLPDTPYLPDNQDDRKRRRVLQQTRDGQDKFRDNLIAIYGTNCMLTGCAVMQAIEASHINPYRGAKDNHPANGLLLRKDFHALFDSNLLGIEPDTLAIHLHPSLKDSYYQQFKGKKISFRRNDFTPSKDALELRWGIFTSCCGDQIFL